VTGILVEPGNPEELAQAVVRVLQNKADASRMGASARASVIESYSWNNVAKSLVHILEAAVDQRSA
jgi:glycosyltransferase involved in cell wall biosynthesis